MSIPVPVAATVKVPKHLTKEDGTTAKQGETLMFKVIDFNKDSKHIILSHSRIFEDEQRNEARKARRQAAANKPAAEAAPAAPQVEKTTLGDVTGLAALKAKLEKAEAKAEPEPEKVEEPKVEAPVVEEAPVVDEAPKADEEPKTEE